MARAEAALHAWLKELGTDLDPEITAYTCSILEDPDPETSLDLLLELLTSSLPVLSHCNHEQQTQAVLKLLHAAASSEISEPAVADQSSPPSEELHYVVEAFKQAKLQCQQQQSVCSDVTNIHSRRGKQSSTGAECMQQQQAHVHGLQDLLELCPAGISNQYITYLLQDSFKGDVQATADWLLECCDLAQQEQQWHEMLQQQQAEQEAAELQRKRTKQQLLDRFDLVPQGASKNINQCGLNTLVARKKEHPETRVRYRDGQVVSSKGEKYILEKAGEDWDGGSRGKVYTKGKRGKGFV